ncbi:ABC transporter permease [Nocardioides sp. KR10-350]|uniref:ABC transporter permease n=1 Tax=Nocardioides cheoyonin TaxID=3156615 RepID=UPI0032B3F143
MSVASGLLPTRPRTGFGRLGRAAGSPLVRLIVKRVLLAIPILLGVSVLTFWVLSLIPGDPARAMLGMNATDAQVEALRHEYHLDESGPQRYLDWLTGALHGDLGTSMVSSQTMSSMLADRWAVTFELVALAFIVSLAAAVPVALLAARWPGGVFDRISMLCSVTGLAVANYVLALLLVLVFAVEVNVLPAIGYVGLGQGLGPNLKSMVLPTLAMAIPLFCFYTRFLRGDLVDQMQSEDYVDTARAKGIGPWRVLWMHAFRNSSFGMITIVGLNIGTLVGGTVIIEQIFALPGLGQLLLQGINTRDTVVVQDLVIIFAAIAVFANLLVDVLYAVLDPRIRYGSH